MALHCLHLVQFPPGRNSACALHKVIMLGQMFMQASGDLGVGGGKLDRKMFMPGQTPAEFKPAPGQPQIAEGNLAPKRSTSIKNSPSIQEVSRSAQLVVDVWL